MCCERLSSIEWSEVHDGDSSLFLSLSLSLDENVLSVTCTHSQVHIYAMCVLLKYRLKKQHRVTRGGGVTSSSSSSSSVARRPPLIDFSSFGVTVLRRRRREEAEREVASREEKRREDGFPVNRPGRLARAQTRATLRRVLLLRRRRHGGLFFTKTTKMCAYVQSALINNGKMCGEKLSRIGSEKVFTFCGYIRLIF